MKRLRKELVLLLKAKEDIEQQIKEGKLTCSAHPLLIRQLEKIDEKMDKNFKKLFSKMEKIEKDEIAEEVKDEIEAKAKKEKADKKSEDHKIWKERGIGALFTLIILIIVYLSPL